MDQTAYVITAILAGICLLVIPWKRLLWNSYRLPPGPKREPIIQNLRNFPKRDWYKTFTNWQQEYGDLVYANVLGSPFLIVNSLEIAKELLEKRGNIYSGRIELYILILVVGRDWNFIEAQPGPFHSECRAILRKAIGQQEVAAYDEIIQEQSKALVDSFQGFEGDPWPNIYPMIAAIIIKIAYGESIYMEHGQRLAKMHSDWTEFASPNSQKFFLVNFMPWLHYLPDWLPLNFKKLGKHGRMMQKAMRSWAWDETIKHYESGIAGPSMALEYIQSKKNMDVPRDAIAMMYTAGVDNTSSALIIFFSNMLLYPDVQRKIQLELDRELDEETPITPDDRPKLPYLDAAWRESKRLYPSNPLGLPHRTSQEDHYDGIYIPKKCVIYANIGFMCRDPRIFDDPDSFIPERWLPDHNPNAGSLPDVDDIVFGFGRRICPGQFLAERTGFVLAASTLKRYTILPIPGEAVPKEYEYMDSLVRRPKKFRCKFVAREVD